MAGGGQDRVLQVAGGGVHRQDAARAELRPRIRPGDEIRGRRDITVGGPALAAEAIKADLVDECHLIVVPVVVGSGKKSLPGDVRLQLQLLDERRFSSGVVHLSYRIVT